MKKHPATFNHYLEFRLSFCWMAVSNRALCEFIITDAIFNADADRLHTDKDRSLRDFCWYSRENELIQIYRVRAKPLCILLPGACKQGPWVLFNNGMGLGVGQVLPGQQVLVNSNPMCSLQL